MLSFGFSLVAGIIGATGDLVSVSKVMGRPISPSAAMYYCSYNNPINHSSNFAHRVVQLGLKAFSAILYFAEKREVEMHLPDVA